MRWPTGYEHDKQNKKAVTISWILMIPISFGITSQAQYNAEWYGQLKIHLHLTTSTKPAKSEPCVSRWRRTGQGWYEDRGNLAPCQCPASSHSLPTSKMSVSSASWRVETVTPHLYLINQHTRAHSLHDKQDKDWRNIQSVTASILDDGIINIGSKRTSNISVIMFVYKHVWIFVYNKHVNSPTLWRHFFFKQNVWIWI